MREQGVSLWLLMAREYFEEPVIATMLDARSMAARRRTILIFFDPGEGQPIERLTVSRYGLAGLFEPAWDPDVEPDQWRAVADIITARDPGHHRDQHLRPHRLRRRHDAEPVSRDDRCAAGGYEDRIVSGETLSIRWLETRTPSELEIYPGIVRIAHSILARAFPERSSRRASRRGRCPMVVSRRAVPARYPALVPPVHGPSARRAKRACCAAMW
jgi:hypothetical protein